MDGYDRRIVGFDVQAFCRDDEAIETLHLAVDQTDPEGIREADTRLKLVHDNGSQFTSRDFQKTLDTLGIVSIRTAYKHPRSNGLIERWFRSLKEEEVWLHEYTSISEVQEAVSQYVRCITRSAPIPHYGTKAPWNPIKSTSHGWHKKDTIPVHQLSLCIRGLYPCSKSFGDVSLSYISGICVAFLG